MNRIRNIFILFTLLVATTFVASAGSVKITIEPYPGRSSIAVGDKFYVTVELDNVDGQINQLNVPGASFAYSSGAMTYQSASYSGGSPHVSTSSKYTLIYRAQEAGNYKLPAITVAGVKSNSPSYSIKGGNGANTSQPGGMQGVDPSQIQRNRNSGPTFIGKGNGNLFMRASVSKTNAFEQEALVYTVKLYSSYKRVKFIGATASPKFEGFVVEVSDNTDKQFTPESYNGRVYNTAVIARYIIFPQMKGALKVLGNTYTVSVDESEYYHDSYFGGMTVNRPLQLNVTPNDLTVNVKPLPEPKPTDFSGGVGKFTISSSMPSTQLRTGETSSIVYTVTGSGNLKYITLPELSSVFPKEIEVFSPQTDVKTNVGVGSVNGTVKFDYSLMPDEEGNFHIPDVTLVYFNPETGAYEKSVAKGYNVTVGKGNASSKSQSKNRSVFDGSLLEVGKLKKSMTHDVFTFGYWLFFLIPVLLLFGCVIGYRKYLRDNADLSAVLSRKANKIARRRLRKAEQCIRSGKTELFYDEMLAALWGYVSDKLKMPNSELNRENVSDELEKAGVDSKEIDRLINLLDRCEFAKYSPESGTDGLRNVYDEGAEVINELEDAFKARKQSNKPNSK